MDLTEDIILKDSIKKLLNALQTTNVKYIGTQKGVIAYWGDIVLLGLTEKIRPLLPSNNSTVVISIDPHSKEFIVEVHCRKKKEKALTSKLKADLDPVLEGTGFLLKIFRKA